MRHGWELNKGNNSKEIVDENKDKEREEEGNIGEKSATNDLLSQIFSHKAVD